MAAAGIGESGHAVERHGSSLSGFGKHDLGTKPILVQAISLASSRTGGVLFPLAPPQLRDVALVFGSRLGEDMASSSVGDKKQFVGGGWVNHCRDNALSGVADGSGGQTVDLIGAVGVGGLELALAQRMPQRNALGQPIDDGRVGLEPHMRAQ